MSRRFWFRSRPALADYAPEVLHAGWVPLLSAELLVTAVVLNAPGMPAHPDASSGACAGVATAAGATVDADIGDLLARFYANQDC